MTGKRIIVHVGQSKAGSSTLQASLKKSKSVLQHNGVCYVPAPTSLLGTIAGVNQYSFTQKYRSTIKQLIDRAIYSKSDVVILSSEFLFGGSSQSLRSYLQQWSDNIEIVIYIRDPLTRYISSQQQILKKTDRMSTPHEWNGGYEKIPQWKHEFGDACRLIPFVPERLHDGCIVKDFAYAILGWSSQEAKMLKVVNSNISERAEVTNIIQSYFRAVHPNEPRRSRRHANRLRNMLQEICTSDGLGTKSRANEHTRQILLARHADQLRILKNKYGVEFNKIFYDDIEKSKLRDISAEFDRFSDIAVVDPDVERYITMKAIGRLQEAKGLPRIWRSVEEIIRKRQPDHMRKRLSLGGIKRLMNN